MSASPTSDLNILLVAAGCKLVFKKINAEDKIEQRVVTMSSSFFPSYGKTSAEAEEVLISVEIPFTSGPDEVFRSYKQSKRRCDDMAIVNAAFNVKFKEKSSVIEQLVMAYGGVSSTTIVTDLCASKSIGKIWNDQFADNMSKWLENEIQISASARGGMIEYRRTLIQSLFFKFFLEVKNLLHVRGIIKGKINERNESVFKSDTCDKRLLVAGTQIWDDVPDDQPEHDQVGRPMMHLSALKQVTGEARYVDDMPRFQDELHLALVTSTESHAKILKIDISEASKAPGFVDYIDSKDVPGENALPKNSVFAHEEVACFAQVLGAVVADTHKNAQRAAKLVKIKYEVLESIVSIEDAIKNNSFYDKGRLRLVKGDTENAFKDCKHVIEGEVGSNSQEHFYLETQVCIAVPTMEDGEMEIFCSTQHPSYVQQMAAKTLGVDRNKLAIRVKRVGGGFGGKQISATFVANPVVVAANKLGKPVRCMLSRKEDMLITGARHSFYSKYKVGFDSNGKIEGLNVDYYTNVGHLGVSCGVLYKAIWMGMNCYKLPNAKFEGYACKTNIPVSVAARAYGSAMSMFVAETWITHIAEFLDTDPTQIRTINMWDKGHVTPYNQTIETSNVNECWRTCLENTNLSERKISIEKFNADNRWKKRGIASIPLSHGVVIAEPLNQASALVVVYTDGSVLLTYAGVEIGQGLNTKMIQIASKVFGINTSNIHISETTTSTAPNTSPTAASISSDVCGMAVKDACMKILSNLDPVKQTSPNLSWNEIVQKAYSKRIALMATGFYCTPDIDHEWDAKSGIVEGPKRVFNYYTNGAAVSEVEIDCLTGDHVVLRTDIVMDVGKSLNPAVDLGQIEGAFMMGYGFLTLEDPLYSPDGRLRTVGPGTYKIPSFGDIPKQFNVHFLSKSENERAIYSSKAVGEPPLILASSVFFAIREAIKSARKDAGITGYFQMNSPASAGSIRMACVDNFTKQSKKEGDENATPWAIRLY